MDKPRVTNNACIACLSISYGDRKISIIIENVVINIYQHNGCLLYAHECVWTLYNACRLGNAFIVTYSCWHVLQPKFNQMVQLYRLKYIRRQNRLYFVTDFFIKRSSCHSVIAYVHAYGQIAVSHSDKWGDLPLMGW